MSLKSLNLNLSWSSQPHMVKVSHPVMQPLLKVAIILPPTSMGPDTQTSWLPSTCAGCFREVRSCSTTPCTTVINARLHILTSQPLYWLCHDYAPPQFDRKKPPTWLNVLTYKWMKLAMAISSIENSNLHIQIKNLNICTTHNKTHGIISRFSHCASVIWMTLSAKSSAFHPGSQLLSTLISLLAPSTSTTTLLALHFSLHSPPSPLPSPLLFLLLLLGSLSEIQEFSLS